MLGVQFEDYLAMLGVKFRAMMGLYFMLRVQFGEHWAMMGG